MHCLSVRQPSAYALCVGAKQVENRSRRTSHRGLVAIHVSAKGSVTDLRALLAEAGLPAEPFLRTRGHILGVAELFAVVPAAEVDDPWAAYDGWCWRMRKPRLLREPIPYAGKLGIFELDAATARRVQEEMRTPGKAEVSARAMARLVG